MIESVMPNSDPMAEALASLGVRPPNVPRPRAPDLSQPYRTKKGAIKFQPETDWSLDRLTEVESEFQRRTGRALPIKVRGQGAIHNKWDYAHENSADISLSPRSAEGRTLMAQLQEQRVPFLAFDKAIPGVSTGEHFHIGRPSKRRSQRAVSQQRQRPSYDTTIAADEESHAGSWQGEQFTPAQGAGDPMADALASLKRRTQRVQFSQATQGTDDPMAEALGTLGTSQPQAVDAPQLRPQVEHPQELEPDVIRTNIAAPRPGTQRGRPGVVRPDAPIAVGQAVPLRINKGDTAESVELRALEQLFRGKDLSTERASGLAKWYQNQRINLGEPFDIGQVQKDGENVAVRFDSPQLVELANRQIANQKAEQNFKPATKGIVNEVTALAAHYTPDIIDQSAKKAIAGLTGYEVTSDRVAQAYNSVQRGIHDFAISAAQSVPLIAASIDGTDVPADKMPLYVLLETVKEKAHKLYPNNPKLQEEYIASKIPQGIGSSIGFLAIGALTGGMGAVAGGVGVGTAGALSQLTGMYQEAKAKGATEAQAREAMWWGIPIGASEVIGVGSAARRLNALTGGTLKGITEEGFKNALKRAGITIGKETGEEAFQNTGQGIASAAVAKHIYDSNRDIFGTVEEDLIVGVVSAFLMSGAASAPNVMANAGLAVADKTLTRGEQRARQVEAQPEVPAQPETIELAKPLAERAADPMADALAEVKIRRAKEPYAGPAEFRGMAEGDLYDLASRRPPKGTSRQRRLELIRAQAAAIAEIDRRQNEVQPTEVMPRDTGLRAVESETPSFREYVENRPEGGTRFETLDAGTPDFNRLAGEYVDRHGTHARQPREAGSQSALRQVPELTLPFLDRARSARRFKTPFEITYEIESGRQRTLMITVEKRQEQLERRLAALKKLSSELAVDSPNALTHLKNLGEQIDWATRKEIEESFNTHLSNGLSEYDASAAALSNAHKRLFEATNEMRVAAGLTPVAYTPPQGSSVQAESGRFAVHERRATSGKGRPLKEVFPEAEAGQARQQLKELPPIELRTLGRESQAVTERGSEVSTRYAVVDLNKLVTSHDSALRPNPDFPPELQPRERDRAASAAQISRIASSLRPEFLGESPKAGEGAPIVGQDGIVESGNGRVLALRQAYESNNQGAQAYSAYIFENAERLGLDRSALRGVKSPVLVRIRTTEVDRAQFVKEANEQSIASMSPVEQARSDATSLKGNLLDMFRPSESGEIATAANMNFIRAFMKDVVGPNEINRYITASGQISQEGISRIRNGIFARAYGDSPEGLIALEKLAESPDSNVRNITTAMLRNAPGFASLKEGIDQGTRYPLDLASDVSAAMSKLSSLRDQGMLVPDYLRQGSLYGEDLSPIQKRLLQVFDENKRGANTIDGILRNYLRGANAAGSPAQAGFFGTETPSKADFLEAAIKEAIHAQVPATLFETRNQGLPSEPAQRGKDTEADTREPFRPFEQGRSRESTAPTPTSETEGRTLKRFDSTIDRLKAQEEEARQRLTERGAEYQKLLDKKGSELGATTIPQDLYDYVVIGASKLAQRSLNVAQFIDEMVREFGESIRKHARSIFQHSQRMVTDTQKEIRAERLSKEIADRLFTENVPREQQQAALKIAKQFRTSTDTQGKFLSGFKSRVGEMAKSYGAAGGELTNRVHLGDIARAHEMEAGNKYLSKIQDVYEGIKNDFERQRISNAIINALENRSNADKYLDTPEKKAVYQNTVEMLDMFRAKLKALGYETRDDYFTHIRDVDVLDQILSDAKDPKDTSLNDLVAAKSRFLQARIDAKMEIKKDLPRVLYAYLKSVTKEIAYSDAVNYYYDHFLDDIPISLRKNSVDRAIKLMQNSLKPEQGRGRFFRTVGRLRSEQYRNFLAYNLKASAQNFTQVDFARMRWTKEANNLTNDLWRKRKTITGPLADAIEITSTKETPLMRFLEQFKGEEPAGSENRFVQAFNRYDPFQRSERRNWGMSEMGSLINSVVKNPEYKTLKAKMEPLEAVNELLKKQDVFDKAIREAATTAAETQVAANPAMRGEFYDVPLHRIVGMFTAFKTRQLQILGEALRSHEGINGARAQTILRRGLSGDAQPVEVLREIEAQRLAMEKMVERAGKFKENLGIPRRSLDAMIRHLKTQEAELNTIIKRIEPLSGSRARSARLVAKYFAKVSAVSVFFNLFWDSVYTAMAGPEDDKDAEGRVSTALKRAFWDVLPSPFYGANPSKFLVSPVAPNFERSAPFGRITRRGLARDVASYGTTIIPFAGVIDRATNRRLSGAIVDLVAPKKEREKKLSP